MEKGEIGPKALYTIGIVLLLVGGLSIALPWAHNAHLRDEAIIREVPPTWNEPGYTVYDIEAKKHYDEMQTPLSIIMVFGVVVCLAGLWALYLSDAKKKKLAQKEKGTRKRPSTQPHRIIPLAFWTVISVSSHIR